MHHIWSVFWNTWTIPFWHFRRVRQLWIWSTGSPWAEAWELSEDGGEMDRYDWVKVALGLAFAVWFLGWGLRWW